MCKSAASAVAVVVRSESSAREHGHVLTVYFLCWSSVRDDVLHSPIYRRVFAVHSCSARESLDRCLRDTAQFRSLCESSAA